MNNNNDDYRIQIIPEPTKDTLEEELRYMYRDWYKNFRKDELKAKLLEYFFFLEKAITWDEQSHYADNDFTINELENMIVEMIPLYERVEEEKRKIADIL